MIYPDLSQTITRECVLFNESAIYKLNKNIAIDSKIVHLHCLLDENYMDVIGLSEKTSKQRVDEFPKVLKQKSPVRSLIFNMFWGAAKLLNCEAKFLWHLQHAAQAAFSSLPWHINIFIAFSSLYESLGTATKRAYFNLEASDRNSWTQLENFSPPLLLLSIQRSRIKFFCRVVLTKHFERSNE